MPPTATSTTAWIWWRSRCGRDGAVPAGRPGAGTLHARPAHPPALAGPSRPLAGRRGMALPVVVGRLPAADARAAHPRRGEPPPAGDPGDDAGGHRATRRPVLSDRHASLAGQLAAAGAGGEHAADIGFLARVRDS